jgi:hypothetical protein
MRWICLFKELFLDTCWAEIFSFPEKGITQFCFDGKPGEIHRPPACQSQGMLIRNRDGLGKFQKIRENYFKEERL